MNARGARTLPDRSGAMRFMGALVMGVVVRAIVAAPVRP